MTTDTQALLTHLSGLVEGNRYALFVTGATTAVGLQFQHVEGGDWFPLPGFVATPAAGVVSSEFLCPTSRMRVTLVGPQNEDCTITWIKITQDTF